MKGRSIKTTADLATALKCDPAQVSRYTRRADWRFGKGPWKRSDLPAMQRWRAATLKPGAPERAVDTASIALRQSKLTAEVRRLNAQADAAETELARERGKLIPIAEVTAEWERIGQRLRHAFETLAQSIIPDALTRGLPMTAAADLQSTIDARVRAILRMVSDAGHKAASESEPTEPPTAGASSAGARA